MEFPNQERPRSKVKCDWHVTCATPKILPYNVHLVHQVFCFGGLSGEHCNLRCSPTFTMFITFTTFESVPRLVCSFPAEQTTSVQVHQVHQARCPGRRRMERRDQD